MRDPLSGVGMATSLSCEGMLNEGSLEQAEEHTRHTTPVAETTIPLL